MADLDVHLGLDADTVLTTTRAVRRRLDLDRPVSDALIRECLEIALQAPSGSNKQLWRFIVVRDEAVRAAMAEIYRRSFEVYRADAANSARLFAGDPAQARAGQRVFDSAEYLAENLHRVPVLLVPVVAGRCEKLTSAHAQANYWGGIAPAVWSFMLAARERGLGTSWTTMHLRFERDVADVLSIPEDFTQAALVPVAHTIGTDFKPGPRQPLDEVLQIDGWKPST
jgi:nitroreductase